MKSYFKPNFRPPPDYPKVSIHIPTYNEPSEVVIQTIKSCLRIDYPNYEIIVLDNNTTDNNLWEPVAEFCSFKNKIKFLHIDNLPGFKAGALNKCLEITAVDAEYIFVVDADYILSPNCLYKAVGVAKGEHASLVQFPQNYSFQDFVAGVNEEYNHYFKAFARGSNYTDSMLSTGTLSLYAIEAIRTVGGWKTSTITEDAEMGMKFHKKQLKTVYADMIIGQGMLPNTLKDMRIQRERWAFGNIQCLLKLIFIKNISLGKKLDVAMQLTAWINFLGFSILTLLALILGNLFYEVQDFYPMVYLIGLNIGLYMVGKFLLFGITTKFYSLLHFQSFLFHMSMLDVHTFGWWDSVIGNKKPFQRTNKFFNEEEQGVPPLGLSVLICIGGIILILKNYILLGYLFIIFASINYMGIILISQQLLKFNFSVNLKTAKP